MGKRISLFDVINYFIMLIIFVAILYPVLYTISISFSDSFHVALNDITFYPKGFNLDAYEKILEHDRIPRAYLNTIIYTTVGTTVNVLMTIISAYPLSRKTFFGKSVYMRLIVFTMLFTGGIIPNYLIVSKVGLIDSMWALILPNAVWTFELLVLKSFFESMPNDLHESAHIDGASEFLILFKIYVPLSKAALASIGLFYFMGHWNSFFNPMIYFNTVDKFPLQVILRDMLIQNTVMNTSTDDMKGITSESLRNATIFISMIPILIVYPFAQKYFASGVMLGSVKG